MRRKAPPSAPPRARRLSDGGRGAVAVWWHGTKRRRALGQHFLRPGPVPEAIVTEFAPQRGESVLEVGPGRGVLTRLLLSAGARVLAVELDARLARQLEASLQGDVQIVQGDALEIDLTGVLKERFGSGPVRALSSLPYSTGTAILDRLCDQMPPLTGIAVLLQEEVVERATAAAGDAAYGYLSVMVHSRCRARAGARVRPGAFNPPPRVDSRMLWLAPRPDPPVSAAQRGAFLRLVGQLFAHRRKTMLNNLRAAGLGGTASGSATRGGTESGSAASGGAARQAGLSELIEAARAVGDLQQRPGDWSPEKLAALFHRLPAEALAMLE